MTFKEQIEQSPVVILSGFVVASFIAGATAVSFINEHSEKSTTPQNIASIPQAEGSTVNILLGEIKTLLEQNVELKAEIAAIKNQATPAQIIEGKEKAERIIGGVNIDDIEKHGILGGPNSFLRKPFG